MDSSTTRTTAMITPIPRMSSPLGCTGAFFRLARCSSRARVRTGTVFRRFVRGEVVRAIGKPLYPGPAQVLCGARRVPEITRASGVQGRVRSGRDNRKVPRSKRLKGATETVAPFVSPVIQRVVCADRCWDPELNPSPGSAGRRSGRRKLRHPPVPARCAAAGCTWQHAQNGPEHRS